MRIIFFKTFSVVIYCRCVHCTAACTVLLPVLAPALYCCLYCTTAAAAACLVTLPVSYVQNYDPFHANH